MTNISTPIKAKISKLSQDPGIYKMLDADGHILYVGKAKHLKKRVASYFSKQHDDLKTKVLVSKIKDIEVIITGSEQEALILERQLIRKIQPRYNILLKDDKSYPYIKVTLNEPFPRVLVVREKHKDGAAYYGPYPSIGGAKFFQQTLETLFELRDCKKPIELVKKQRKCIQLDIGNCMGPCLYKNLKPQYDHQVQQLIKLLKGQNKPLIKQLKIEMSEKADKKEYEKAAILRDRIEKINALHERQIVDLNIKEDFHVWVATENSQYNYVLVQKVFGGKLLYQKGFYTEKSVLPDLQDSILQAWLEQYPESSFYPKQVLCADNITPTLTRESLVNESEFPKLISPQKGVKKQVILGAMKNAKMALLRLQKEKAQGLEQAHCLSEVQESLALPTLPEHIIGLDISHLQGTNIVASAVNFKNGKPDKSHYRKMSIKTVSGKSNDPESMKEALYRICHHFLDRGKALPDLVLIDGGRGQINFAKTALIIVAFEYADADNFQRFAAEQEDLFSSQSFINIAGQTVSLISLAKREEEIYFTHRAKPLKLSKADPTRRLLEAVRDESHRFAVRFQRQKRKQGLKTELDGIDGLGPKRVNQLYKTFKDIEGIKKATVESLQEKAKLPLAVAQNVYRTLNPN